jgi:hypothetical protein
LPAEGKRELERYAEEYLTEEQVLAADTVRNCLSECKAASNLHVPYFAGRDPRRRGVRRARS